MTTTVAPPVEKPERRGREARPQLPAPVRPQRRWSLVAVGVALLAASVFGVTVLVSNASQTVEVVALSANVDRGEAIESQDLVLVQIPVDQADLATVPGEELDSLVGRVASADLIAGTTLAPGSTTTELLPAPGSSIVGLALSVGQLPNQPLQAGDTVRIVETPVSQGDPPTTTPQEFAATVLSVAGGEGGYVLVDLEVADADAADVAARAFTGRVALVLDTAGA